MASLASSTHDDGLLQLSLRMFPLNTDHQCRILFNLLKKIIHNILTNPTEPKYRTVKLSNKIIQQKVVAIHGGIEFLQSMQFRRVTERREQLLFMSEVDVSWLETGLATLDSLTLTPPPTKASSSASPPTIGAECILHIVLPTGHTLRAGFMRSECIQDIYNFVDYSRTDGKRNRGAATFVLSMAYPPQDLIGPEWLQKTIQEAGLAPRAKLMIKKEKRADAPGAFQDKPADHRAREEARRLAIDEREERARIVVEKKKMEREAVKMERERAIRSFKDDRTDVVRRTTFETLRDQRQRHENGWRQRLGESVAVADAGAEEREGGESTGGSGGVGVGSQDGPIQ